MATTSTSARFTRSWVLSNASGTPKRLLAASADSRRLVDSAVISKSSGSDLKAGMCACAAQPRSGLAPMMPTRILLGIMTKRIRVGIIGANPDRGWAAQAHIPALRSLPDDFEITALSTSRRESAEAASRRFGVPLAFDNTQDLVNSADVDVVAITVKVPHHFELATAALTGGKGVYW